MGECGTREIQHQFWEQYFQKQTVGKRERQDHNTASATASTVATGREVPPLLLVFLVCGGRDFLKLRPVRPGTSSALALEAVLSADAGAAVVAAGAFRRKKDERRISVCTFVFVPSLITHILVPEPPSAGIHLLPSF